MGKPEAESSKIAAQGQADAAKSLVGMTKDLWAEAKPYRSTTGQYWTDVVKGGPSLTRAVAPQINTATSQFNTARKSLLNLNPGGLRDTSLRDLRLAEAGTKTGIYSSGITEALARLAAQGTMSTQAGIGSMGSAGSTFGGASSNFGQLAQMQAQSAAGMASGIGSLVAMI